WLLSAAFARVLRRSRSAEMLGEVGTDSMPWVVPRLASAVLAPWVEDGAQQVKHGDGRWRPVGRFDSGEPGGSGGGYGAEDDRRAAWCRACTAVLWCGRSAVTVVVGLPRLSSCTSSRF